MFRAKADEHVRSLSFLRRVSFSIVPHMHLDALRAKDSGSKKNRAQEREREREQKRARQLKMVIDFWAASADPLDILQGTFTFRSRRCRRFSLKLLVRRARELLVSRSPVTDHDEFHSDLLSNRDTPSQSPGTDFLSSLLVPPRRHCSESVFPDHRSAKKIH